MLDELNITVDTHESYNEKTIALKLYVNGQQIRKDFSIDIFGLVRSLSGEGEFQILNCSCGEPVCARIDINCIVLREKNLVRWLLSCPARSEEEWDSQVPYEVGDHDRLSARFDEYYFAQFNYSEQVQAALTQVSNFFNKDPNKNFIHCGHRLNKQLFLQWLHLPFDEA